MFRKTPLREAKQPTLTTVKGTTHNFKQTCKPCKVPSTILIKKENIPKSVHKPEKQPQKKELLTKSPITTKREVTSKSVREIKPKQPFSMMAEVKQQLYPCKQCGRTFVETALKRHQKICKKIFINKRKEFNSAKQRFASKDQLNLYKKNKDRNNPINQSKSVSSMPLWKQQSLAFRLAMKEVKGAKKTQQELEFQQKQKKIMKSSMFKCKFCNRNFNQEAGKRHEGFCAQKAKDMNNKAKRK